MSDFKENIISGLVVFTFIIPVIPIGGYMLYDNVFGEKTNATSVDSNSNTNTDNRTYDSESDYTYEDSDPLRGGSTYSASSYSSDYSCTSDCSGHEAGYQWGEDNDICDVDYDNGNSESFNEGVRAYAEENCSTDDEYSDDDYDYYR